MKSVRAYLLAACGLALAGCEGAQSALDPHGPAAGSIAALTWFLFGLMTAVFAIVIVAASLAIGGPETVRRFIAQQRAIVAGGIVFPAVVLSGLLIYGLWLMRADTSFADPSVRIEVSGEQWWWRIRYHLADGRTFESANEIRLPVGRSIALTLTSPDVIHSLWIPSLAGKLDMIPGRTTQLRLKADRPGVYRGACAEYCGGPHALMALHAVAMPEQDFASWLDARTAVPRARDEAPIRGQQLFLAAGCGGCHAIDGSDARGTIGPNLTDLGSRPSIGAGLLPMSRDSLVRFVVRGQHLKPGNRMPPFDFFDDGQLADLASYLLAVR
jgi:cytochrome c oxidase subunit 2